MFLSNVDMYMRTKCNFLQNYPPTANLNTLSLHGALPISTRKTTVVIRGGSIINTADPVQRAEFMANLRELYGEDRKSTRLNSSDPSISYAVFCLKKKNTINPQILLPHATTYGSQAHHTIS